MSDLPGETRGESISDEYGTYSVDDEDQLQPEDTLMDTGVDDVLDVGFSPPDKPVDVEKWGLTPAAQAREETIDERVKQEEPDWHEQPAQPDGELDLTSDAPSDDHGAAAYDTDDEGEVGGRRAGRLVSPDEGRSEDTESELIGRDVGIDGGAASAEEAAMHVVDEETLDDETE